MVSSAGLEVQVNLRNFNLRKGDIILPLLSQIPHKTVECGMDFLIEKRRENLDFQPNHTICYIVV